MSAWYEWRVFINSKPFWCIFRSRTEAWEYVRQRERANEKLNVTEHLVTRKVKVEEV